MGLQLDARARRAPRLLVEDIYFLGPMHQCNAMSWPNPEWSNSSLWSKKEILFPKVILWCLLLKDIHFLQHNVEVLGPTNRGRNWLVVLKQQ